MKRAEGDGRERIAPQQYLPGTMPMHVTKAQARASIERFEKCGCSTHSGRGATLWVILEHCVEERIGYKLHAMPGMGYYIEKAKGG